MAPLLHYHRPDMDERGPAVHTALLWLLLALFGGLGAWSWSGLALALLG